MLYAEGVAFFLLLSIIGAYLMPMTRKHHEALRKVIALKKAGKAWDQASLSKIL